MNIGECIGQDQSALSVCVAYFYMESIHAFDDVSGQIASISNCILCKSTCKNDVLFGSKLKCPLESSNNSAGSTLISVHVFHEACGLDIETTGIISYTLSDECKFNFIRVWVALVMDHNTTWLANGTLANIIK